MPVNLPEREEYRAPMAKPPKTWLDHPALAIRVGGLQEEDEDDYDDEEY
jgi:hypothetical protein